MLARLTLVFVLGFLGGRGARWLWFPPLVGMVAVGMALGPFLDSQVLASAPLWRTLAVAIIPMKAGLGLDWERLKPQGSVALRLGFLPALSEMLVVALLAVALLGLEWRGALILGCIIGAESPAVIVPGMLRLKSLGWGVAKGIPDAILTGSALSDVLLEFSILIQPVVLGGNVLAGLLGQVVAQIALGAIVAAGGARGLQQVLSRWRWTENRSQDVVLSLGSTLALVLLAEAVPLFSGYLAVMAVGFFLGQWDRPLARRLRRGFDALWIAAEIALFVLLGASIPPGVLGEVGGQGWCFSF